MLKPFKKIKSHFFNNVEYSIEWEDLGYQVIKNSKNKKKKVKIYGETDNPKDYNPTIVINPKQGQKELLNSLIHEGMHASNFKLDERVVGRMADDIADFVWKVGFRLN